MAQLFLHGQSLDRNTEPFRGSFAFLEHLDLQRRVIGHKRVNLNQMGDLWVSDEKRGLYRFASGIGKAAGKRDMKNIFKGKMERLDYREIAKAIEWPIGGGFSSLEIR